MQLLKVSVPNFRNLQNVELTFEPDLKPAVFPIASQNGGGKSTLLQLIFILFHCFMHYERNIFIENMLNADKQILFNTQDRIYSIANFDILYKDKILKISFCVSRISQAQKLISV